MCKVRVNCGRKVRQTKQLVSFLIGAQYLTRLYDLYRLGYCLYLNLLLLHTDRPTHGHRSHSNRRYVCSVSPKLYISVLHVLLWAIESSFF